jgi:hypothetical protein
MTGLSGIMGRAMRAEVATGATDPAIGINATYTKVREYTTAAITLRDDLLRRYLPHKLAREGFFTRWYLRLAGFSLWGTSALRLVGALGPTRSITASDGAGLTAIATEDERQLPEFEHATAEFWIESFAADCCTRFNLDSVKVLALRQVNELRDAPSPYQRLTSPGRFLAVAGIALGLFASLVPKEAFEALGWTVHSYGVVRAALAIMILSIAAYLAYMTILDRADESRVERRVSKTMPDVLTYCEIVCRSRAVLHDQ